MQKNSDKYHFSDFTESAYASLLDEIRRKWEIIPYRSYRNGGRMCLLRHDVDWSVQRAHRLAVIEAEKSIHSTFFIHLHNVFYNPLEFEVAEKIFQIIEMGHDVGLHFDPSFYFTSHTGSESLSQSDMQTRFQECLYFEKNILEKIFGVHVRSFSLHNPDMGSWLDYSDDEVCGMINAYGSYIHDHYKYISDSNGYWRFDRLQDIVSEGKDEKIHALIHPGWWTPEAMSPRDRISRCIEGRAASQHKIYDEFLAEAGRKNVGR